MKKKQFNNKYIYFGIVIILVFFAYIFGTNSKSSNNPTAPTPTPNVGLCTRTTPYDNPPEFQRAVSLIIQRFKNGPQQTIAFADSIDKIKNCLDIKYASSENEITGADGEFVFSNESTSEDLKILISPKYQTADDLLTAMLLSHELTHALFFANGNSNSISCFENEAWAFTYEQAFLILLNAEEKKSLVARVYNSDNVRSTAAQIVSIDNQAGNNGYEQALNYVKNDPDYIKECSGK